MKCAFVVVGILVVVGLALAFAVVVAVRSVRGVPVAQRALDFFALATGCS